MHASGAGGQLWAADRLTRRDFARPRFRTALRVAAGLWGRLIEARAVVPQAATEDGHFQAIEIGDVLLSTLDLGGGEQSWHFTPTPGSAGRVLLLLRLIRGGWLQEGDGPRVWLPAGQIALLTPAGPFDLGLPDGGRCDLGLIESDAALGSGVRVLAGTMPSVNHLAFVAGYLLRCAPHPEGRSQELKQMLFRALDHVLSDLGGKNNGSAETPFERFKFLIGANLGRADLSLEEVAAAMEFSPRQLQRFLQNHGTSFRAHLLLRRLHHAHDLIEAAGQAKLRVADLAWRCGFRDPNYFSRAYAKHWKVPPSRD